MSRTAPGDGPEVPSREVVIVIRDGTGSRDPPLTKDDHNQGLV